MTTIPARFKIRRDSAADWTSFNPVLLLGEPALETDTLRVKYGDGSTAWTSLPYAAGSLALGTGVATALGVNVGSAGAFVVNGGALGTPSSGSLVNCTFPTLNQNTTGSAATLTTTRTIWGQNFNGSADVSGTLALGTASLTLTGSIGSTGSRATKLWSVDAEFTNAPTIGGNGSTGTGGLVRSIAPTLTGTTNLAAAIHTVADAAYSIANNASGGNLRFYPYYDATSGAKMWAFGAGYSGEQNLTLGATALRVEVASALKCVVDSTGILPYSTTTASGANVFQNASGSVLLRSTSSSRYKTAVRPLEASEADAILKVEPIAYRSTAEADDGRKLHWGVIAEQAAEHVPQLVHYDEQGRPDGFQYDRAFVALLSVAQRLTERVEALEAAARRERRP